MKYEITDFNIEKGKCYLLKNADGGYASSAYALNISDNGKVVFASVYRDGTFGYPMEAHRLQGEGYMEVITEAFSSKVFTSCEEYSKVEFINRCYDFVARLKNKVDNYFNAEQE